MEVLKMRKSITLKLLDWHLYMCKYIHALIWTACSNYDLCLTDGDTQVGENSIRVFANRRQCKGQLEVESQYLIMGKDGSTRDALGRSVRAMRLTEASLHIGWLASR